MTLLQNKSALITGCNRGIGRALLETFASQGCSVWAGVRRVDSEFEPLMRDLSETHGVKIRPLCFDLTDENAMTEAVQSIRTSKEPLDILVNNAAVVEQAAFQMTPVSQMKQLFDVNYFGQMKLSQLVTKLMIRHKKGSILNISSNTGIDANEGLTAYSATKAALINSTVSLSRELAPFGIRVNALAPGLTETEMMSQSTSEEGRQKMIERISLKRVAQPHEIAQAALFFVSDLSSYVTGQVLRVDGGL